MPYTLAYKDRFLRADNLKAEPAYDPEVTPFKPLSSGLNYLLLILTADEFTKLWSSTITGSELMFPYDRDTLELILLGASSMTFCDEVANCIETSANVQSAINGIAGGGGNQGYNNGNSTKVAESGANYSQSLDGLYSPENACSDADKDKLWGVVSALVDAMHDNNGDFLEDINAQAENLPKLFSELIEAIPLVQELPADDALDLAVWAVNRAYTAYLSLVDDEFLYARKCELFCLAVAQGCTINTKDIFDLYASEFGFTATAVTATFFDAVAFVTGTELSSPQYYYALSYLQLLLGVLGETFKQNRGLRWLAISARAGALNPSRAWSVYCDECSSPESEWIAVFDFSGLYQAETGETVYRLDAAKLGIWGANSTTATVDSRVGVGLIVKHPSSSTATRRFVPFSNTVNFIDVEYKARRTRGLSAVIYAESSGQFQWSIPDTLQESGIIGGGYNGKTGFYFTLAGGDWDIELEWIKIRSNPVSLTPPPIVVGA